MPALSSVPYCTWLVCHVHAQNSCMVGVTKSVSRVTEHHKLCVIQGLRNSTSLCVIQGGCITKSAS